MADWKETVNIKDLHEGFNEGTFGIAHVAGEIAKRLRKTRSAKDPSMLDIIEQFESLAEDSDDANVSEYDDILEQLYDFADGGHRLWVKTVS
jgi:hypothetical protein